MYSLLYSVRLTAPLTCNVPSMLTSLFIDTSPPTVNLLLTAASPVTSISTLGEELSALPTANLLLYNKADFPSLELADKSNTLSFSLKDKAPTIFCCDGLKKFNVLVPIVVDVTFIDEKRLVGVPREYTLSTSGIIEPLTVVSPPIFIVPSTTAAPDTSKLSVIAVFPDISKLPPIVALEATSRPTPALLLNVNVSAISAVLLRSNGPDIVVAPATSRVPPNTEEAPVATLKIPPNWWALFPILNFFPAATYAFSFKFVSPATVNEPPNWATLLVPVINFLLSAIFTFSLNVASPVTPSVPPTVAAPVIDTSDWRSALPWTVIAPLLLIPVPVILSNPATVVFPVGASTENLPELTFKLPPKVDAPATSIVLAIVVAPVTSSVPPNLEEAPVATLNEPPNWWAAFPILNFFPAATYAFSFKFVSPATVNEPPNWATLLVPVINFLLSAIFTFSLNVASPVTSNVLAIVEAPVTSNVPPNVEAPATSNVPPISVLPLLPKTENLSLSPHISWDALHTYPFAKIFPLLCVIAILLVPPDFIKKLSLIIVSPSTVNAAPNVEAPVTSNVPAIAVSPSEPFTVNVSDVPLFTVMSPLVPLTTNLESGPATNWLSLHRYPLFFKFPFAFVIAILLVPPDFKNKLWLIIVSPSTVNEPPNVDAPVTSNVFSNVAAPVTFTVLSNTVAPLTSNVLASAAAPLTSNVLAKAAAPVTFTVLSNTVAPLTSNVLESAASPVINAEPDTSNSCWGELLSDLPTDNFELYNKALSPTCPLADKSKTFFVVLNERLPTTLPAAALKKFNVSVPITVSFTCNSLKRLLAEPREIVLSVSGNIEVLKTTPLASFKNNLLFKDTSPATTNPLLKDTSSTTDNVEPKDTGPFNDNLPPTYKPLLKDASLSTDKPLFNETSSVTTKPAFNEASPFTINPWSTWISPPTINVSFNEISPDKTVSSRKILPPTVITPPTLRFSEISTLPLIFNVSLSTGSIVMFAELSSYVNTMVEGSGEVPVITHSPIPANERLMTSV